jgi:hypothetical protein
MMNFNACYAQAKDAASVFAMEENDVSPVITMGENLSPVPGGGEAPGSAL